MTLEEAVADLERGRMVVEGKPSALSQTGEPYIALVSGHSTDGHEGAMHDIVCLSRETAIRVWHLKAIAYANNHSGTLYWRSKPKVECDKRVWVKRIPKEILGTEEDAYEDHMVWSVYSRLLISDKPVIASE